AAVSVIPFPVHRARPAAVTADRVEALHAFAAERGVDILRLAIGGLAAQPAVGGVIAGATRPEQVRANVAAGLWQPDQADLEALAAVNRERGQGMTHRSFTRTR
ncbi:MAG: hypothetical protein HOQ22_19010, partial [Nocardioidaceae bacterium]|nr:hypothetical protein [Nocardioidaceae bacterium]